MSQLENLLQQCTVKLTLPGRMGWGTGFFVAPEWILTCAHVVQDAKGEFVQVRWQKQENWAQAVVERSLPEPFDLALLHITLPTDTNPPCVYLDEAIRSRDPLYLFGYPDQDFPNGCPVTFNCEGLTGDEPALIKFALGQVRPGMSGAPLLNQRTGKVCGIVKFTRDRSIDLGGGAIPTRVILEQFPELRELQQQFYQSDQRWDTLVIGLSGDAAVNQTNLSVTNNQIRTGVSNTNFIGEQIFIRSSDSSVEFASSKNPEYCFPGLLQWLSRKTQFLEDLQPCYEDKIFSILRRVDLEQMDFTDDEVETLHLLLTYWRVQNNRRPKLERFKYMLRNDDFLDYLVKMTKLGKKIRGEQKIRLSKLIKNSKISNLVKNLEE